MAIKDPNKGNHNAKDKKTLVVNPFTGRLVQPKYLQDVLKKKKILQESAQKQNTKKVPLRNSANANILNYRGGMFGLFDKAWQKDPSKHASLVEINKEFESITDAIEKAYIYDTNLKNNILTLMLIFNKNLNWYVSNKINDYDTINDKDVMTTVNAILIAIDFFSRLKRSLDIIKQKTEEYIIKYNGLIQNLIRKNYCNYQQISDVDSTASTAAIELYNFLKEELGFENKGSAGEGKGITARVAVDNIDTELKKDYFLIRFIRCIELLEKYIKILETYKVGGRKMKALPNTPKKASIRK
jgi:hypothetical protein